jgi:hypothetical protein
MERSQVPVSPAKAWLMVALCAVMMGLNYADKAILGFAAQPMMQELKLTPVEGHESWAGDLADHHRISWRSDYVRARSERRNDPALDPPPGNRGARRGF